MREILFRGKDIRGNWHIGLLAHIENGWYISNKAGVSMAYEVIPETIGQYTGLTDKTGKKIFEGDIVKKRTYQGNKLFPVEFGGGMFYCGFGGGSSTPTHRYTLEDKQIIVIGNIHDNPELLKRRCKE